MTPALVRASFSGTGTSNVAIVAAQGANKVIQVWYIEYRVSGDTTLKFRSASTDLTGAMTILTGAGSVETFKGVTDHEPVYITAANEAFNYISSVNVTVAGHVIYNVLDKTS